jgi:L-fuculose-phosphate aldolase
MTEQSLRDEIVEASRQAERHSLNSGTAGNISARLGDGMLITPTGVPAADLDAGSIVAMDLDGGYEGAWRPSSEWMMHSEIFKAFPQAMAVVHTHPDHCVAVVPA